MVNNDQGYVGALAINNLQDLQNSRQLHTGLTSHTVLHTPSGTEKLVLEMGQDHWGISISLSELAYPKTAIVTLLEPTASFSKTV